MFGGTALLSILETVLDQRDFNLGSGWMSFLP